MQTAIVSMQICRSVYRICTLSERGGDGGLGEREGRKEWVDYSEEEKTAEGLTVHRMESHQKSLS